MKVKCDFPITENAVAPLESGRTIRDYIFTVRGIQVMVDWDLAALYGVETRVMNQAVKRNEDRFPERFRFRLSQQEMDELITNCDKSGRLKHYPGLPYVFTEQGIAMLASVLRSVMAIAVSMRIMDAFVEMRRTLAALVPVTQMLKDLGRKCFGFTKMDAGEIERIKKAAFAAGKIENVV